MCDSIHPEYRTGRTHSAARFEQILESPLDYGLKDTTSSCTGYGAIKNDPDSFLKECQYPVILIRPILFTARCAEWRFVGIDARLVSTLQSIRRGFGSS